MIELDELLSFPKSAVLFVLRVLWWFAWEFLFEGVGWAVGWVFYRTLTFGSFPKEGLREQENAGFALGLFVEVTGLSILAVSIWFLSGQWPS